MAEEIERSHISVGEAVDLATGIVNCRADEIISIVVIVALDCGNPCCDTPHKFKVGATTPCLEETIALTGLALSGLLEDLRHGR